MEEHECGVRGDGEREGGGVDGHKRVGEGRRRVVEGEVGEGDVVVEEGDDEGGDVFFGFVFDGATLEH